MTRVRWTTRAASDVTRIVERIREDNKGVVELRTFPNRGRIGLAPDTRELVFPPSAYIVVYEIIDGEVQVLRIRHAAQDWP